MAAAAVVAGNAEDAADADDTNDNGRSDATAAPLFPTTPPPPLLLLPLETAISDTINTTIVAQHARICARLLFVDGEGKR